MCPKLATPGSPVDLLLDIVPENMLAEASAGNMLPVIFFCIALGLSIAGLPDRQRVQLTEVFDAGFQMMMRLTQGVMVFLPIGVFALLTRLVGESGLESPIAFRRSSCPSARR